MLDWVLNTPEITDDILKNSYKTVDIPCLRNYLLSIFFFRQLLRNFELFLQKKIKT